MGEKRKQDKRREGLRKTGERGKLIAREDCNAAEIRPADNSPCNFKMNHFRYEKGEKGGGFRVYLVSK